MEQLSDYPFISAFLIVGVAGALAALVVFPAGALRGAQAAGAVLRLARMGTLAGALAVIAWAVVSGQWERFAVEFGPGTLLEMSAFVYIFWCVAQFLAGRYYAGKRMAASDDPSSAKCFADAAGEHPVRAEGGVADA